MSPVQVRLRVGGERYAVPIEHVLEVAELGDVAPVPGASAAVLGVRNLRGHVLPVLDLATLLGVGGDVRHERIVVMDAGGERAGLAVDEVLDVVDLPALEDEGRSELVLGSVLLDGDLVGVLDVGGVLAAARGRMQDE